RRATGLVVLRVRTEDQEGSSVLDFRRCAMLPLRDEEVETGHDDDVRTFGEDTPTPALAAAPAGWRLGAFRAAVPGPHFEAMQVGQTWRPPGGDVVTGAPELARLTLN